MTEFSLQHCIPMSFFFLIPPQGNSGTAAVGEGMVMQEEGRGMVTDEVMGFYDRILTCLSKTRS